MTDFVRRIVSGNKTRFKDDELKLELDLVYVTDQVIIMGYPASGLEGIYRNRREDVIRFLEHRHGKNFWVFNFCPIKENSYDSAAFGGRVSRYPFPDHHAPPLVIMPLVTREIDAWLKGSKDRVAVLHCKAGKGRSGTMACAYLLAHEQSITPPKLQRSYSTKEWLKRRIQETMDTLSVDDDVLVSAPTPSTAQVHPHSPTHEGAIPLSSETDNGPSPISIAPGPTANPERLFTNALKGVLDLHTARRMKIPLKKDSSSKYEKERKVSQGVSIPSQRRFLYYWALLLAQAAPKHLSAVQETGGLSESFKRSDKLKPMVRLTRITVRVRETSSVTTGIVNAANRIIERTSMAKGPGVDSDSKGKEKAWASCNQVWASLSRYDDDLVGLLEQWEVHTRDLSENLAKRRPGSEILDRSESMEESEILSQIFTSGKWDKGKMVRSFSKFVVSDSGKVLEDKEGKIYTLKSMDKHLEGSKNKTTDQDARKLGFVDQNSSHDVLPETNSMSKVTLVEPTLVAEKGIVLDAGREVKIKFYMGQIFMGWIWFIPTFHMPQPPPSFSESSPPPQTTFFIPRNDIDFAIGIGGAIVNAEIEMHWVVPPSSALPSGPTQDVFSKSVGDPSFEVDINEDRPRCEF